MSEERKIHLDVYFRCLGQTYPVGHGDIPYAEDIAEQGGLVASLLHELAWAYEETSQHQAAEAAGEAPPRKAITRAGDEFFEVAPNEFVAGMSFDDANETYQKFGGASSLEALKKAFPGLRWEYV